MPLREFKDPTTGEIHLKLVDSWGNPIAGVGSAPQQAITVNPPQPPQLGGGTKDITAAPAKKGKTPVSVGSGVTAKEPTYKSKTEQAYRQGKPQWVASQEDLVPELGRAVGSIPFNIVKSFAMLGEYIDDRKRQIFGEPRATSTKGFENFYKTGQLPYGLDQGKLAGFGMTAWNAITRSPVMDLVNLGSRTLTGRPVTPPQRSEMQLPGLIAAPVKAFNRLSVQGGGIEPRTLIGGGVSELASFALGSKLTNVSGLVGKAPAVPKVASAWSRAAALKPLESTIQAGSRVAGSVDEIANAAQTLTRTYPLMGLPARSRDAQKLFGLARAFPDYAARAATVAGAGNKLRQFASLGKQSLAQSLTWGTVLDGAVYDLIKAVGTADQDAETLSQRLFRMSEPKRAAGSPLDLGRDARNIFWQTVDNLAFNLAGETLITGMRIAVPAMRLQKLKGAEYDAAFRAMADDPVLKEHLIESLADLAARDVPDTVPIPTPKATAAATDAPFVAKNRAFVVNPEAPPPPGPYNPQRGVPNPEAPPAPPPYRKPGEGPIPPPPPYRPTGEQLIQEATAAAKAQTPRKADFPQDPTDPDFIVKRAELLGTRPQSYIASILSADTNGVQGLEWNDAYSRAIREAQASGVLRTTEAGDVYVPIHLATDADEANGLADELISDFAAANALEVDTRSADETVAAIDEETALQAEQPALPSEPTAAARAEITAAAQQLPPEVAGKEALLSADQPATEPPIGVGAQASEPPTVVEAPAEQAAPAELSPAQPEQFPDYLEPTAPGQGQDLEELLQDLVPDVPEPEPTNPFELSAFNAEEPAPDPIVVQTQTAQQLRDFNLLASEGRLEEALNTSPLTPFELKYLAFPETLADLAEFPGGELPEIDVPFPTVLGGRVSVRVGAQRLPARWAVIDLAQTPRSQAGTAGQFRDRSRAALQEQVGEMAADLHPDELFYSPRMDGGAPTLTADGVIVGGNGRADAIDLAYQNGAADNYRQRMALFAKTRGIVPADYAGFERPAIVRVVQARGTQMQERLAIASNVATAQQSALELSRRDAINLADLVLRFDDQGRVDLDASGVEVSKWMDRFERTERVPLTTAGGALSPEGETRLRNAVLFQAYGDSRILQELIEPSTESGRNLRNAIMRASGDVATLQQQVMMGAIAPEYAINDTLRQALDYFYVHGSNLHAAARQQELLNPVSYESRRIAVALADNNRSSKAMASIITRYVEIVQQNAPVAGQESLFGTATTRAEYLDQALKQLVDAEEIKPSDPGLVDAMRRAAEPVPKPERVAKPQPEAPTPEAVQSAEAAAAAAAEPVAMPEAPAVEAPAAEAPGVAQARRTLEGMNETELRSMANIYEVPNYDQLERGELLNAIVNAVARSSVVENAALEERATSIWEWLPKDRDYSYFDNPMPAPGSRRYKRELTRRQAVVKAIPDMPADIEYYPAGSTDLVEKLKAKEAIAHYNTDLTQLTREEKMRRLSGQDLALSALRNPSYGDGDVFVARDSAGRFAGALAFNRDLDEVLDYYRLDIDLLGAIAPGTGAGSKLIAAVKAMARHEMAEDLHIGMALADAIPFYQRQGFMLVQGEDMARWGRARAPHMRMGENLFKSDAEIKAIPTPDLVEVVAGVLKDTQTRVAQVVGLVEGLESQNLDEWALLPFDHPDSALRHEQLELSREQIFEVGDRLRETMVMVSRNPEKWGIYGQQLREASEAVGFAENRIDDLEYRISQRRQELNELSQYGGEDVGSVLDGDFPCE